MSDREYELLDLAAKFSNRNGSKIECPDDLDGTYVSRSPLRSGYVWNPLEDDGDAMRLAMLVGFEECVPYIRGSLEAASVHPVSCRLKATRLAITLAAAELEKSLR